MRIFITGASGFIGGAIAKGLSLKHEVLAMSRSDKSDKQIEELGVQPVRSDLASLKPGDMPECDAVVHCAAYVEPWGTRALTWQINVEGTERTLNAAKAAGANQTGAMETIIQRPRFVWGPGDQTLAPEITAMVEKGAFMWLDGGRAITSTTHIANLVYGAALLLEHGRGGEAYFVTDDEVYSFRDFLPRLMATYGVELGERTMPSAVVLSVDEGLNQMSAS